MQSWVHVLYLSMIIGPFDFWVMVVLKFFMQWQGNNNKMNNPKRQHDTKMLSVCLVYQLHKKVNIFIITYWDTCSVESKHGARLGK